MASLQGWIAEHKISSIGAFWASTIGASLAYSAKRTPFKPSLRLIHARMHAQALTLAVLSGAAIFHHYGNISNGNADIGGNYHYTPQSEPSLLELF
ncbi:Hypoxia induced protein conserved region [Carex littledalei]|uniref:Hypoxia induced protein conserved region n=1 Tax=Carex littledalei TaxID=544730 RepID=A0A833VL27_9POAL|nr:Hypoxia induced protein conserved region [Carex littledalei]